MFGRRSDASEVRDAPATRRFLAFLSPRRSEALVFVEHEVCVEAALAFVERWNEKGGAERPRMTLFHLVLRAIARVLHERPRLNRFTAGGRLWQRDGIWLSFSAKQRMEDGAPVVAVKRRIDPEQPLAETLRALGGGLAEGRSGVPSTADRELALLLALPAPLTRLVLWLLDGADNLGLLPRALIDPDPMFCSAFVANLGSVGLDAGYHHLWEHGNCPLFCVIGRVRPAADGRRVVTLKWSFDERVEDGLYCALSLERLRELLEKPEQL